MFASNAKRQDGWWYPWLFVGAFAIIITVNGIMAYLAVDTWTGLETEKSFEKSQSFNAQLAQQAAQERLGWSANLSFEPLPTTDNPRAGFIKVMFTDVEGQGVGQLTIDALAMRPTHEGFDRKITFADRGQGLYVAPADLPLAGQWELRMTASRADEVFKLRQRIQVP